eukprot:71232_1
MCPTGARTVNPCAHVVAVLMFILLVRSNRLNHPLITQPSEPINCALYERYAKRCPCSWVRPPPKPPAPSSNDSAINVNINVHDTSDIDDHDEEEKQDELLTFPGDDIHDNDNLSRNNSNNIIISNRCALERTLNGSDDADIESDADSFRPME